MLADRLDERAVMFLGSFQTVGYERRLNEIRRDIDNGVRLELFDRAAYRPYRATCPEERP